MLISQKVFFLREEFAKASCSFMDDADYDEGEKITVKYKNEKKYKFKVFFSNSQLLTSPNNGKIIVHPFCYAVLNHFGNNVDDGGNKKKKRQTRKQSSGCCCC